MLLWLRRGGRVAARRTSTTAEVLPPPVFSLAVQAVVVASRQEFVARRLTRAIDRALGRSPNPFELPNQAWNDERQREIAANIALTLHPTDSVLRKAFKTFGLDHKNPLHWRILLKVLVDVHFNRPHRGTPPKWNPDRWLQFESHVAIARTCLAKNGDKPPSQERIAEFLKEQFREYYRHLSATTIRRYLTLPPPAVRKSRGRKR